MPRQQRWRFMRTRTRYRYDRINGVRGWQFILKDKFPKIGNIFRSVKNIRCRKNSYIPGNWFESAIRDIPEGNALYISFFSFFLYICRTAASMRTQVEFLAFYVRTRVSDCEGHARGNGADNWMAPAVAKLCGTSRHLVRDYNVLPWISTDIRKAPPKVSTTSQQFLSGHLQTRLKLNSCDCRLKKI